MRETRPSRRDALHTLGGALLAGIATGRTAPAFDERPADDLIVDTHIHVVESRLPGAFEIKTPLPPFGKTDPDGPKKFADALTVEAKTAGVGHALCMPRFQVSDKDPLGIGETLEVASRVRGLKLHPVGLAHPERFDRDHLARVEAVLKKGRVKALKAYLGYLHYEPLSPGYRLYFKLAAKYDVPVIFHCGDTFSRTAKVKYSHPVQIDEVAVDFPKTKFVIAHFGNPWLMDAAQVVYKNENVWIDLSGILVGDADAFAQKEKGGVLKREVNRIKQAIEYMEAPDRFLYGTDWPLAPMPVYRDFVRRLFPEKERAAVFGGTAKKLFGL